MPSSSAPFDNVKDNISNAIYKLLIAPVVRFIYRSKLLHKKNILPRRIVICGPPRTGTTLMSECMRSFEDVYVLGYESPALRFPYVVLNKRFIVTKYPRDIYEIDRIISRFDNPWIIFMLRDPRDVLVSQHYKAPGKYWVDFSQWKDAVDIMNRLTEYRHLIVVRYEDLIDKPMHQQNVIADLIGLEPIFPFTDFHRHVDGRHRDIRALSGVRPINGSNRRKWLSQEHKDRVKEQLQKYPYITKYLIEYEYENDSSWESYVLVRSNRSINN